MREFSASGLGFKTVKAIPLSARYGDNMSDRSTRKRPGIRGRRCSNISRPIDVREDHSAAPFRFPVQWVNRPNLDFRGYTGTVAGGRISVGEEIAVANSGRHVEDKSDPRRRSVQPRPPQAGDAVTITLNDELDIARGDVLCRSASAP